MAGSSLSSDFTRYAVAAKSWRSTASLIAGIFSDGSLLFSDGASRPKHPADNVATQSMSARQVRRAERAEVRMLRQPARSATVRQFNSIDRIDSVSQVSAREAKRPLAVIPSDGY